MERRAYNYRNFRISRLNEPRFSHIRMVVITWLIYFTLYFLTENLIPAEACHPMHCMLDDMMPFCEYFAVFYVGWYLLVAGTLAYYLFYDVKRLRQLDLYIFITQIVAMTIYILYPSRQDLRPEFFVRENIFTWIMGIIYTFDTNTGVCPSLHVAYSIAILSVMLKDKNLSVLWKVILTIFVICVAPATVFVKQHSMIDVIVAVPVALLGEIIVYHTKLGNKLCNQDILPERKL